MTATKKLSKEERYQILLDFHQAKVRGDEELAHTLSRKLPLHPSLAVLVKKWYGVQTLIDEGFDLSDVREAFGDEWFDG